MSSPRLAYPIIEGPSRADLILALFDRKHPSPVKFVGTSNGRKVDICVWVKGLIQTSEDSWKVLGTLTANSPLNPSRIMGPSFKIECFYNDLTGEGSLTDDGLEEAE